MAKEQGYHETGIYYNIALVYSHLEIEHLTLHFANIALKDLGMNISFVM